MLLWALRQEQGSDSAALTQILRWCAKQKQPGLTIKDCQNLAPAGTGTSTLFQLQRYAGSPWRHHCHAYGAHNDTVVPGWQCCGCTGGHAGCCDIWQGERLPPQQVATPSCYVMTVRDPVVRLASGLAFYAKHAPKPRAAGWMRREVVQRLKTTRTSEGSDQLRHMQLSVANALGIASPFLLPVTAWVRRIDCKRDELHLLCTEELNAGWLALQHALAGDRSMAVSPGVNPATYRDNGRRPSTTADGGFADEDAAFLRMYYREDFLLWKAACIDRVLHPRPLNKTK